jgi:3'-phosphoadenosine 5'-phosphosulfate sulfotransferase (PAPS reductase)/FAD synthetase
MDAIGQQISDTLADIMRKHQEREKFSQGPSRVALLYSGGIESSLLLRLMEPWRSQVRVYTVRTGAEFPHMVEFIDRKLSDWDHRVIHSDLAASFRDLGIPASVVPIEHLRGIGEQANITERSPRIVPWHFCCTRNRAVPGYEAIGADGLRDVIHGQRAGDWPTKDPKPLTWSDVSKEPPVILRFHHPLWDVSRAQVQEAVTELGIELPAHYAEYPSSLDCSICPSSLTTRRRAWMEKRYPEPLAVAEKLHSEVTQAVVAALNGDNTKNGFTVQ